jgi:protocadherin Fat 4
VFGAKAVDDDDGENSRIAYRLHGKDSLRFLVDPHTGVVRANENLVGGGQSTYQLQIEASDCGAEPRSISADLVVHLWERQLFPSFRPATATRFTLKEDALEGRVVTTMSATTPKDGPGSDLVFGMAGGNVGEALRVGPLPFALLIHER